MPKTLAALLPHVLKTDADWKYHLLRNWSDILGPLASKVQLKKVYNDTLILGVQDSCWMQEMHLLSPVLLKTINKTLDQPYIKQVRFTLVGTPKKKKEEKIAPPKKVAQRVRLTPTEKRALEKIGDDGLRQALKNFLVRCHQER